MMKNLLIWENLKNNSKILFKNRINFNTNFHGIIMYLFSTLIMDKIKLFMRALKIYWYFIYKDYRILSKLEKIWTSNWYISDN